MHPSASKVLLVDDDPAMLRLLARWLENAGYQVTQASDGQQALEAAQACAPHFVVTDWQMPNLDGVELCRRLRSLPLPHYVYIIFVTQRAASDDIILGLEAGADDFLPKPVDKGELLARLRSGSRVLELENRLLELAHTDALTGIPTRKTLLDRFDAEWSRARRYRLPLSCVMFDIDFFKRINDVLGHTAGDQVIQSIAGLLRTSSRVSDLICRYGGEEFCAVLPETTEAQAYIWAERLRRRIADQLISAGGKQVQVTASFGVAQRLDDTDSPAELLDLADQAMLVAKQSGRDRVGTYSALNAAADVTLASAAGHGAMFGGVLARHVMNGLLACLEETLSVGEATEFFLDHRINSAPVVAGDGKLIGILSEKDLINVMLEPESWQTPIRDCMKTNVVCYDEETPVLTIYDFLCRVSIRRVVIVKDGVPRGVISRGSLLQWFSNWVKSRSQQPSLESVVDREQSLLRMAADLAERAAQLLGQLEQGCEDLTSTVIGSATQMQTVLGDLLVQSRFADGSPSADAVGRLIDSPVPMETGAWFPPGCLPEF